MHVYIGTYTGTGSKGIYRLTFDEASGKLAVADSTGGIESPSFLALAHDGRALYAVSEVDKGEVVAYRRDPVSGELTPLNRQSARGVWPCHITLDKPGRHALVANYGSGSFAVLPIQADGSLAPASCLIENKGTGPNKARQEAAHGHSIDRSPDGRYVLACDLGLDKVFVYRFDAAAGQLVPHSEASMAPGAGPRHLVFHPKGGLVFVINELNSTVTTCRWDAARGTLTPSGTLSTLPEGFAGENTTAEIAVHPSGRFVYGSNRGHHSLAVFKVDERNARLTAAGHVPTGGKTPRNFALAPGGKLLIAANQDSDNLLVFRVNGRTGMPSPLGTPLALPRPVCVCFAP